MIKKRVIPLLLLNNGRMVKGKQFSNFRDTGNPSTAVKIYSAQDSDELIMLDIQATIKSRVALINVIKEAGKECLMPFSVGGGIKTIDHVREILSAGADKVVITTSAIENPKLIEDVSKKFGSQCVIAGIDYKTDLKTKKRTVWSNCGTKETNDCPVNLSKKLESLGAGEIIINSITNDGMMQGYDILTAKEISSSLNIPVIVCGGAGNFEHLVEVFKTTDVSAVACSSLFHFGDNNPIRARSHLRNHGIDMRITK